MFSAIMTSHILFNSVFLLFLLFQLHVCYTIRFLGVLGFFLFFFFPLFSLGSLLWPVFRLTHTFFSHVKYADGHITGILFCYCVFISSISSWFFLRVLSLCLLICSCMLSTFFIRVLGIFFIVTSNSLSGNFYHYVMYFVLMVVSFLQTLCVFFLAFWHAL